MSKNQRLNQIIRILQRYQVEQPSRYNEYAKAIRYIRLVCFERGAP
jgi:hypothetical protein